RRTVAGRLGARRTAARRTVALRTVALRTAAGRTAARPPGSGPGGERPGRGGAAAGAGHELERHLIAWLDADEKGHLVEALSLAEEVPGEAGARLRQEDMGDPTRCRLGRWCSGRDGQRLAGHPV